MHTTFLWLITHLWQLCWLLWILDSCERWTCNIDETRWNGPGGGGAEEEEESFCWMQRAKVKWRNAWMAKAVGAVHKDLDVIDWIWYFRMVPWSQTGLSRQNMTRQTQQRYRFISLIHIRARTSLNNSTDILNSYEFRFDVICCARLMNAHWTLKQYAETQTRATKWVYCFSNLCSESIQLFPLDRAKQFVWRPLTDIAVVSEHSETLRSSIWHWNFGRCCKRAAQRILL